MHVLNAVVDAWSSLRRECVQDDVLHCTVSVECAVRTVG